METLDAVRTPDVAEVREGLPFDLLQTLVREIALTTVQTARLLGISARTLERRRVEGRLSPDESNRLLQVMDLWKHVLRVFEGDRERARTWLTRPKHLLGGESPLQRLDTYPGARQVEQMLLSIEFSMPV